MKRILIISLLFIVFQKGYGQLNPMGSIYYQNQYLANPAMAGSERGWELNAAYKAQWVSVDGAPKIQTITAAYGSENKKIGFGILFYNDMAGVVERTSLKATYAYHLPLNNGYSFIDFGLSIGFMDESINNNRVIAEPGDFSIANFDERMLYVDSDFGITLRVSKFTLQGALPNLKRFLKRDRIRNVVDRSLFMSSVSYKFINNESSLTSIEPKIVFRKVENYKNLLDAGANFQFNGDKLLLSGMYHSSGSITFGAGTTYKNKLGILAQYTTNTTDLKVYTNGEFEIGLKYNFR